MSGYENLFMLLWLPCGFKSFRHDVFIVKVLIKDIHAHNNRNNLYIIMK